MKGAAPMLFFAVFRSVVPRRNVQPESSPKQLPEHFADCPDASVFTPWPRDRARAVLLRLAADELDEASPSDRSRKRASALTLGAESGSAVGSEEAFVDALV